MSFEGYYQILCRNGHLSEEDVYSESYNPYGVDKRKCRHCGEFEVWRHLVDQTNDEGEPVKLQIKKEAEICKCNKCDNEHTTTAPTYHIPKGGFIL